MGKLKELLKPTGKIKINKIFVNSRNKQLTVVLPRKKLKGGIVPDRIEILYWRKKISI